MKTPLLTFLLVLIFFSSSSLLFGQADVIVTDISWTPSSPVAGKDLVKFKATIKNIGTAATPSGVIIGVKFYVDGAGNQWSDTHTTSLAPGASVTVTANAGSESFDGTWTPLELKTYVIRAWVDDINRFPELNETNNKYQENLTITSGLPNLSVAYVNWTPQNAATGTDVTFKAQIRNYGPGATIAGVVYRITWEVDGVLVAWTDYSSAIPNYGGVIVTASNGPGGNFKWKATTGPNIVNCTVDALNTVVETDEYNTHRTQRLYIPNPGIPDLILTDVVLYPTNPKVGQKVQMGATIKNVGTGTTLPNSIHGIAFYIDGVKVLHTDQNLVTDYPPGAEVTVFSDGGGINNSPYWTVTAGTHTLEAFVDDVNRIVESNETNNKIKKTFTAIPASSARISETLSSELLTITNFTRGPELPISEEEVKISNVKVVIAQTAKILQIQNLSEIEETELDLVIFDLQGKVKIQSTKLLQRGHNTATVDVSTLTKGLYIVKGVSKNNRFAERIIVIQ